MTSRDQIPLQINGNSSRYTYVIRHLPKQVSYNVSLSNVSMIVRLCNLFYKLDKSMSRNYGFIKSNVPHGVPNVSTRIM